MDKIAEKFISLPKSEQSAYFMEQVGTSAQRMADFHEAITKLCPIKKPKVYLLTFTLRDGNKYAEEARKLVYDLPKRASALGITKMYVCEELTKKDVYHWHVVTSGSKWIKRERFSTYERRFGHVDISPSKTGDINHTIEYTDSGDNFKQLI